MATLTDRGTKFTAGGVVATNASQTSASFTPTGTNWLYVVAFTGRKNTATAPTFTVTDSFTGTGAWSEVVVVTQSGLSAGYNGRHAIWRAHLGASPGTGTVTVANQVATSADQWLGFQLVEVSGIAASQAGAVSGTNTKGTSGTTLTTTLSGTPASGSAVLAGAAEWDSSTSFTSPSGWNTSLVEINDATYLEVMRHAYLLSGATSSHQWTSLNAGTEASSIALELLGSSPAGDPGRSLGRRGDPTWMWQQRSGPDALTATNLAVVSTILAAWAVGPIASANAAATSNAPLGEIGNAAGTINTAANALAPDGATTTAAAAPSIPVNALAPLGEVTWAVPSATGDLAVVGTAPFAVVVSAATAANLAAVGLVPDGIVATGTAATSIPTAAPAPLGLVPRATAATSVPAVASTVTGTVTWAVPSASGDLAVVGLINVAQVATATLSSMTAAAVAQAPTANVPRAAASLTAAAAAALPDAIAATAAAGLTVSTIVLTPTGYTVWAQLPGTQPDVQPVLIRAVYIIDNRRTYKVGNATTYKVDSRHTYSADNRRQYVIDDRHTYPEGRA